MYIRLSQPPFLVLPSGDWQYTCICCITKYPAVTVLRWPGFHDCCHPHGFTKAIHWAIIAPKTISLLMLSHARSYIANAKVSHSLGHNSCNAYVTVVGQARNGTPLHTHSPTSWLLVSFCILVAKYVKLYWHCSPVAILHFWPDITKVTGIEEPGHWKWHSPAMD